MKSMDLSYYACKESNQMIDNHQMKTINCGPFIHTNQTFQAGSNRFEDQTHNHYSSLFYKSFRQNTGHYRQTILKKFDFAELFTFTHYEKINPTTSLIETVITNSMITGYCIVISIIGTFYNFGIWSLFRRFNIFAQ